MLNYARAQNTAEFRTERKIRTQVKSVVYQGFGAIRRCLSYRNEDAAYLATDGRFLCVSIIADTMYYIQKQAQWVIRDFLA